MVIVLGNPQKIEGSESVDIGMAIIEEAISDRKGQRLTGTTLPMRNRETRARAHQEQIRESPELDFKELEFVS